MVAQTALSAAHKLTPEATVHMDQSRLLPTGGALAPAWDPPPLLCVRVTADTMIFIRRQWRFSRCPPPLHPQTHRRTRANTHCACTRHVCRHEFKLLLSPRKQSPDCPCAFTHAHTHKRTCAFTHGLGAHTRGGGNCARARKYGTMGRERLKGSRWSDRFVRLETGKVGGLETEASGEREEEKRGFVDKITKLEKLLLSVMSSEPP